MARRKRQYGSGCLLETRKGVGDSLAGDGDCSRRHEEASPAVRNTGRGRAEAGVRNSGADAWRPRRRSKAPTRSRVTFRTLAGEWEAIGAADVQALDAEASSLHAEEASVAAVWRQGAFGRSRVRRFRHTWLISPRQGYAPKSIDHVHDVLSAVLRTAVKWGHLQENPARGVDLPTLKTVRPKWALTTTAGRGAARRAATAGADHGRAWRSSQDSGAASCSRCGGGTSTSRRGCSRSARRSTTACSARRRRKRAAADPAVERGAGVDRRMEVTRGARRAGRARVLRRAGTSISPNNVLRRAIFPACTAAGTSSRDVAHVPTHVLVVVARQRRARQGGRAVDGPRQRRHDAERVHAGARWIDARRRRKGRRRIVHYCSQTRGRGVGDAESA